MQLLEETCATSPTLAAAGAVVAVEAVGGVGAAVHVEDAEAVGGKNHDFVKKMFKKDFTFFISKFWLFLEIAPTQCCCLLKVINLIFTASLKHGFSVVYFLFFPSRCLF